jgi:hypothetical protein
LHSVVHCRGVTFEYTTRDGITPEAAVLAEAGQLYRSHKKYFFHISNRGDAGRLYQLLPILSRQWQLLILHLPSSLVELMIAAVQAD